ncbi:hypothetical protein HZU77_015135 [Neisseriaceae bacterium TC5R-5]|nr:hypothetical protein [Neisseriaceae bacterium TC5R-5]
MSFIRLGLSTALASLVLLTGCATPLSNATADQAARKVLAQSWQNTRYNIDAEMGLNKLEFTQKHAAQHEEDEEETDPDNHLGLPSSVASIAQISKGFRLNFSGAVDAQAGKVELIPSLRFEQNNLLIAAKVPLQFNTQDMSLLIDVSIAKPFASIVFSADQLKDYKQFLRIRPPAELIAKIPLKEMYQAMPGLTDQAYAQLDPQVFSFQPLDQYASELGATYKIRINTNEQLDRKILNTLLTGLVKVAAEAKTDPSGKRPFNPEEMTQLISMLLEASSSGLKSNTSSDLYAARNGNLLALRQIIDLQTPEFNAQAFLNMRYSNFGKPVFVYHPSEEEITDLPSDVYDQLLGLNNIDEEETANEQEVTEATEDGLTLELEGEVEPATAAASPAPQKHHKKLNVQLSAKPS